MERKSKKHNRRVCYEFARFFAKAINELLKSDDEIEAVMIGDVDNLHYFVGLTGSLYSIILDLDDFNNIKDLTRLKLGLTINGIRIIRDNYGKFQKVVENFNKYRLDELDEVKRLEKQNIIEYFSEIVEILKSYNIDSQGFMEYMRSKIENEGIEIEKVWKEIKGNMEKKICKMFIILF